MQLSAQHTSVLIVGAGPSGLMMAAQLLRNGVQPIIIDSKQGPTNHSNALAVQARSLEIYRQMGIADPVIRNGKQAGGVILNEDGEQLIEISLADVGHPDTLYPFVHMYQQSKNERVLLDFLTQNCCPVYWETDLVALSQDSIAATAHIHTADQDIAITCDWLIGADGAHSVTRKQLQIPFNGDTYRHEFYLADVELDNPELSEQIQLFLAKKDLAAFFPMPEKNTFRIIGAIPDGMMASVDLKLDDVQPAMNKIVGYPVNIVKNNWFSTYRLHHRMADEFRKQRCFLIGDAAHIHSPVGGQGMNTGLQDAYNLAWKLAGVINKQFQPAILESYADERMPVAKMLLNTTDRVFKLILSRNWLVGLLKKFVAPRVLKFVWDRPSQREEFFRRVSQIGIEYRSSKINLNLSNASKIKAGDRLPFVKLFDEKKQQETDLHEWCSKPGFTFIAMGTINDMDLFSLAKWASQNYPGMNFFYLPPSQKNTEVFTVFEVDKQRGKAIIVRPDMYIGFLNDAIDMNRMDNYLRNVLGVLNA